MDDLSLILSTTLRDSSSEGSGAATDSLSYNRRVFYGIGTGAGNVNVQWNDYRILAGSSEDLDLAGGVTNRKGKVVTFADIKGILIRADSANAGNITLRGSITNAFNTLLTGDLILKPGAVAIVATEGADGWAVTAGTADLLRVLGTAADEYEIAIWGEGSEA